MKCLILVALVISASTAVFVEHIEKEEYYTSYKMEHSKKYDDPIEERFRQIISLENKRKGSVTPVKDQASTAMSFGDVLEEEWTLYKLEHSKEYDDPMEERFRQKLFLENKRKIAQHNQLYELGKVTFKMGLNKYADMSHEEFVSTMNGYNPSTNIISKYDERPQAVTYIELDVDVPPSFDWRDEGAVTPVKDQGQCRSCWSFSATGSLEGQHFSKTGELVSLSEQNLIDCSGNYGNDGCEGGLVNQAFQYIKANGGIDTEESYPYEQRDDTCRYNAENSGATVKRFVTIPQGDENNLKEAIATMGPVSVAIDASRSSFRLYSEGVYYDPGCSSNADELDHAVLAVGYGTDDEGHDYWIVKNSWGTTWGNNGYILMARNKENHCGIATSASYPLV